MQCFPFWMTNGERANFFLFSFLLSFLLLIGLSRLLFLVSYLFCFCSYLSPSVWELNFKCHKANVVLTYTTSSLSRLRKCNVTQIMYTLEYHALSNVNDFHFFRISTKIRIKIFLPNALTPSYLFPENQKWLHISWSVSWYFTYVLWLILIGDFYPTFGHSIPK